jgi:hypothetical protein
VSRIGTGYINLYRLFCLEEKEIENRIGYNEREFICFILQESRRKERTKREEDDQQTL